MADPKGFLTSRERELPARRPVQLRLLDWREVYEPGDPVALQRQAGRCMDCGIPFCHNGCPLGNLIPEWNDLTWRQDMYAAVERLHATNNFPESSPDDLPVADRQRRMPAAPAAGRKAGAARAGRPGETAIPAAPSRSPPAPATAAWTSPTTASA